MMTTEIFDRIVFNKKYHTYTLDGQRLTSVSRVKSQLQEPFDKQYHAKRIADREGKTVDDVLAAWETKRQASLNKGTRVHAYIEQVLCGELPVDDPVLAFNKREPEIESFDQFWVESSQHLRPVKIEWVIGDAELGIAGTADTLMLDTRTGKHHLFDWKTGKFKLSNSFQSLRQPFDDFDDCQHTAYSIQAGLYKLIVERNTNLVLGDSYLVHLSEDNYQVHRAIDLDERLKAWVMEPRI